MSTYTGPERRIHKLFITRNTEYHFRHRTCVGVRDLRTGEWKGEHSALGTQLTGAIRYHGRSMVPRMGDPMEGESMVLLSPRKDVVTSPVSDVIRPPKDALKMYCR